ncbi:hypothetical protein EYC84_011911 [Monilinia fructicola]|nr:hypothetical protein EYC84_011911 [Monilinia fructicola]
MYDSDASMRSRASGSMSVDSNFSSATTDGTASTCSSFTEEIAGDYKGNHSGVRARVGEGGGGKGWRNEDHTYNQRTKIREMPR